jgi:hypothetical protein
MIKVTGLKEKQAALKQFQKQWFIPIRRTLKIYGSKMTEYARGNHEYTPRSAQGADASINFKVDEKRIGMVFGITNKTAKCTGKWSHMQYTTFLHEGTGKGYRRSKAGGKYSPKIPKTGYGILADHFIVRAWDKYYDKMIESIRKALKESAQKALEA